ncbi:hypothetical protein CkaCkLH20_10575 [Colletotrichum karsti]|uniref:Uncharacterized protein n=1 Tax=Colletotrichum karsti TaxID=1095194 RepID=A0A9P6HV79_9PEZI|nr:uncharacterized protein CkaCkLH20_10575 [Colletotrichum karsti]KAF9871943.1 hypothetical protein CkaCkLH20_10575 [Colletotrichum karsti]
MASSSSSPVFSGETKVAIMRRVLSDGTVEIYSDSASKAQTDPEHCIDCCTAEECLETYGIEVDTRKASKKAKSSNNMKPSRYWRAPEMPSATEMETPSSNTTSTCHNNNQAFRTITYHATSHSSPLRRNPSHNIGSPSASQAEPFHYHSAHTANSVYSLAAAAAAAATHHRHGEYPFAIVINQTPYLTETEQRAVHAVAMTSRERRPRSDFTPEEQADWEEREWMAMQEDEYERDMEVPLPSRTYRSRNLSPESEYRGAQSVESDQESVDSFNTPHQSRRGSFTSDDDFRTCRSDYSGDYHTCNSDDEFDHGVAEAAYGRRYRMDL